ncbi:MAG: response regulator [Bacteroidetes bacterium]|nr:response regulator [Bacteroidota bacterium]
MKKSRQFSQLALWVFLIMVICGMITIGVMTNLTLRSVEKNLPSTLLNELNDLTLSLEELSELVAIAEKFRLYSSTKNLDLLKDKVDTVYKNIVNIRKSYVFDNMVKASALHAVVAPALADLEIWLIEGISGFRPETQQTAIIVLVRIKAAYQNAHLLTNESRINAQMILEKQKVRLDQFLFNVNLLFLLAVIITLGMVYLLFRQHVLQRRELSAKSELLEQSSELKEKQTMLLQMMADSEVARKEAESLNKELAEKTLFAEKMTDKANAASRYKSNFLANMSHEIRTPMNGIIGMTNLALDTELIHEQQKYLGNIKHSADGLLGLLNDILDFSKIEAGQLLMESNDFSLSSMLNNIISMMSFVAEEKGIALHLKNDSLKLPTFVKGDELRLRQILLNLIGNSIKFTEHGYVTLKVILENREDNQIGLHFMVIDTGIGIPADKQESIFSSFSQADSSMTRMFGGSGLGLTISKQLVEMMGGRIWCESAKGHGTQFHFTVVLEHGDGLKIKQRIDSVNPAEQGHTILLVEDNEINRELARIVLGRDQHKIIEAENGLKALENLVEHDVDLILMDIQMPVMDGLTASTIIRASENDSGLYQFDLPPFLPEKLIQRCKGKHIPIVAMTANAMVGDREKCLAAGMDNYMTKPFDPATVKVMIADCIKP